jgi:hypothetical protein
VGSLTSHNPIGLHGLLRGYLYFTLQYCNCCGFLVFCGLLKDSLVVSVGEPEGKRLLGRPRRTWVDNIKMDLGEIGWVGVDCIGLAQDRGKWRALVNAVMNVRVSYSAGKLSNGYTTGGLFSSVQLHIV